jgi:hypothetical protein
MPKFERFRGRYLIIFSLRLKIIFGKNTQPVFVNVMEPRSRFRQPMLPGGLVHQIGLSHTGPPGWESIPGLLKRFTNTGSELVEHNTAKTTVEVY